VGNQTAAIQESRNAISYGEARRRLEPARGTRRVNAVYVERLVHVRGETKLDGARLPREAAPTEVAKDG
jgi:hypothetical protein